MPPAWAVSSELSVQSSVVLYPFSLDVLTHVGCFKIAKHKRVRGRFLSVIQGQGVSSLGGRRQGLEEVSSAPVLLLCSGRGDAVLVYHGTQGWW